MNLSGHKNDSIKQIITPTLPTKTMALTNNTDLPQPYGSETDPLFTAWIASPVGLTKSHVGLGNVDNTSDLSKPISTLTQAALDLKQTLANKSTDGTFAANSDTLYPSQKAVKTYADAITSASALLYQTLAKLSNDIAGDSASTTKYPSVKAIKDYVDARVTGITAHNSTTGIQGGASSDYYHLTYAQRAKILQAATGATDGYLTAADWTRFDAGISGAATSIATTNFTISEISNRIVIKYGGTEIWSISTAGVVKGKDDTSAYVTP